jgi:hypothetical protein
VRRVLLLLVLGVGSAGCVSVVRWERPGATDAERGRDEAECWARADVERAVPARRILTRSGTDVQERIELVTRREVDWAVYEACMRSRGYRKVLLEGTPNMSDHDPIRIGRTPREQLDNDLAFKLAALDLLRRGVALCYEAGDHASRDLLERLVRAEERHVDWLEA